MDSLDLPTHQLILDDLAINLAESAKKGQLTSGDTANIFAYNSSSSSSRFLQSSGNVLTTSAAETQIALSSFAASISSSTVKDGEDDHLSSLLPQIFTTLNDLLISSFEERMDFKEWPVADQLSFALTSNVLRIAKNALQHRTQCIDAVVSLSEKLTSRLTAATGDAHAIATRIVPIFHGLYRALSSVSFPWVLDEFARLTNALAPLTSSIHVVRRLNDALLQLPEQDLAINQAARATRRKPKQAIVRPNDDDDGRSHGSVDTFWSGDEDNEEEDGALGNQGTFTLSPEDDDDSSHYRLALLSHYRRTSRPLSGHFVLCAATEILGSSLAQGLATLAIPPTDAHLGPQKVGLEQFLTDSEIATQAEKFDLDQVQSISAESAISRKAWKLLLRHAVRTGSGNLADGATGGGNLLSSLPLVGGLVASPTASSGVSAAIRLASRVFHDVQRFVETEHLKHGELLIELYSLESLSESLKLGALASVAQSILSNSAVESHTLIRIRSLLSESAFVFDPLVQMAALQSTSLLVRNYPSLSMPMTTQLRRFVVMPMAMFELTQGEHSAPSPVLAAAAKCLATCVTVVPGNDLAVSTMYTLLNSLGRESGGTSVGGVAGGAMSVRSGISRAVTGRDYSMSRSGTQTLAHGGALGGKTDEQRRLIQVNTIAIVSRLALEVGTRDVLALAISLLLQRMRSSDEASEAAILNNIVPLALAGPKQSYMDVIRAFSQFSRQALTGGANRRAGSIIQSPQLRLARGLGRLKEGEDEKATAAAAANGSAVPGSTLNAQPNGNADGEAQKQAGRKELYMIELLQLFVEKGSQLQTSAASGKLAGSEEKELKSDLQGLLSVIAALLVHPDINPQLDPRIETVSLFRNMWLLSTIVGITDNQKRRSRSAFNSSSSHESPLTSALGIISLKTPTLVPESAQNYVESELKYNSVLKRDYSASALDAQRKELSALIPAHSAEIRSFGFAQVTFLNTIYHLECTRSSMGIPSMVLWYFVNEGLNNSSLVGSMQTIADKVMESYMNDLSYQVQEHSLDPRVSDEVKNFLLGSCHRVEKVRSISQRSLDRLIGAYPALLCDEEVVVTILEMLTLLRQSCEGQYRDEYFPVYHYTSDRAGIAFDLSDSYTEREEILSTFLGRSRRYLQLLLARAPVEFQGILQRYLGTFDDETLPLSTELGKSIAIDFARALPTVSSGVPDAFLPNLGGWRADSSSAFVNELTAKSTYFGEMTGIHLALTKGLVELQRDPESNFSTKNVRDCELQLAQVSKSLRQRKKLPFADLRRLLYRSAALAVALPQSNFDLLHFIVSIPLLSFTPSAISTASHVWTWIIGERPSLETKIMVEITIGWGLTIKERRGLFSRKMDYRHALLEKTEMTPSDRVATTKEREEASRQFTPHLTLIQLLSSRFEAFRYRDPSMVLALVRLVQRTGSATDQMSRHPLSREVRFSIVLFGLRLLQGSRLDGLLEYQLRTSLYDMALDWFAIPPQWSFGSNRLQLGSEMQILQQLLDVLANDEERAAFVITSFPPSIEGVRMPGQKSIGAIKAEIQQRKSLLQVLLENELTHLSVWNNPLSEGSRGVDFVGPISRSLTDARLSYLVDLAFKINPHIAVQMVKRIKNDAIRREVGILVRNQPSRAAECPEALEFLVEDHLSLARKQGTDLKWLLYWEAVTPVEGILLFLPEYGNDPYLLQYAMRALEHHPVDLTFFYVPQLVQALRDDEYGYVAQFIFETSKISQLFCHQIIWNMKANSYKDDDAEVPDPMKPTLDRMTELIVGALSGEAQDFYDREFGFFNEVTSISGKLKPYIKKSKPEKKAKIDEEMGKIKVDPGVYLPSNPDGVVVDLARKSGRPLQSHAKAPFMATFKVRREVPKHHVENMKSGEIAKQDAATSGKDTSGADTAIDTQPEEKVSVEVWQSAIFKVGDDCRQDVLALQAIAMFKNIWQSVGLDLYLYPYRVTATGPGCGVIDVVPNATSRDEMGRAQINDLNAFFLQRFGNANSISYQQARLNFVRSMAGYSLACHLLQIRDRHNGNIMIDGEGHLVHIDFGFLFEIGPGGMRFEPFSFKMSQEFLNVMGPTGYTLFKQLVVSGFLALRPYTEQLIGLCRMMYGTDLPSFKGLPTFDHLRDRFKPNLSDREAAQHAITLIDDAHLNRRAVFYDQIQKLQNGIPYQK
ncbi:uncharacterized protein FA14DRAFT_161716 [Meira miltonrushii]|uniref:1-phosphatidylinositol 4-kinase n=1 Tax=Meira miltonrushii TaxID=1280837 RepID=A0A316VAI5_9BASI|nr:uncharacterized protein FA14DRAFT_161716 [Meira miltonrushii]PWN34264.1 hypothetical protein FA14DRAFT_161716 [Meira miltonrushii]